MTNPRTAKQEKLWSRPPLEEKGPDRTAGGFFRTAEGGQNGLGGVPLTTVEHAVVAAVRMAYKVAETQVERSTRLVKRLREAGDHAAGRRSDRKAVDAAEQLVSKAIISALNWLESAAAEPGSPLKRMAVAQYRLAGSLLGLTQPEKLPPKHRDTNETAAQEADPAPSAREEPSKSNVSLRRVKVVLEGEHRRPVRVRHFEVESVPPVNITQIEFYSVKEIDSDPLMARLTMDAQYHPTLVIEKIHRLAPPGRWKAAICDREKVQIGMIEIEL
jgi:hypothetical protein